MKLYIDLYVTFAQCHFTDDCIVIFGLERLVSVLSRILEWTYQFLHGLLRFTRFLQ